MLFPRPFLFVMLCLLPLFAQAASLGKKGHSASGKPNVLFILADDLRDYPAWMGGHPQAVTPNMDRLAAMGMRFTNAHCNYALCNPSRTSLLTGLQPASSGIYGNEQDWRRSVQIEGKPTLPEHFQEMGFITAAAGKIFHANHGGPEGRLTGWHGGRRGFEQDSAWTQRFPEPGTQIPPLPVPPGQDYNGLGIWHWDWGQIDLPDQLTDDGAVSAWAAAFLQQKHARPFFLAAGLYRPHSPWYVPKKYFDMFPLESIQLPEVQANDLDDLPAVARQHDKPGSPHDTILKQDKWKEAVQAYLASVAFCDAMLGEILKGLEAGPNAANTIVVFTSDHGWYLGEKKMWHKGRLWEEATRVPLTVLAPGVTKAGSSSAEPVSLVDLYPTLCDAAKISAPAHLDGHSLLPLLKNPESESHGPAVTTMGGGDSAAYAARSARWRYIRYADGSEELYDHNSDPHEWSNVAGDPAHAAVKKELAQAFPQEFKRASRSGQEAGVKAAEDGSTHLKLNMGDDFTLEESPHIQGRTLFMDAVFDYNPQTDLDSTLMSQGNEKLGWALHLVAGKPTLTLMHNGKPTSITGDGLTPGRCTVRASLDADGLMSLAVPGRSEVLGLAPFQNGFPAEPEKGGLSAGHSFGPLTFKDFPDNTPWDGMSVQRLRLTVLPPHETVARPATE